VIYTGQKPNPGVFPTRFTLPKINVFEDVWTHVAKIQRGDWVTLLLVCPLTISQRIEPPTLSLAQSNRRPVELAVGLGQSYAQVMILVKTYSTG
jgi:hypothetical protein